MKKKIGFNKKIQGIFTQEFIEDIKTSIKQNIECELIEVDFREGVIINNKVFVDDICLNDLDVYFWHDTVYPNNWKSDNYFLHILKTIEKDVSVINTSASTNITNDKFLSHLTLKNANLPVGDFALVQATDTTNLKKVFKHFREDVLLKPRFGGWGIGISRAKTIDDLMSTVEYMLNFTNNPNQSILLERFYENDLSKWISVVVFGDEVIFGYKKPLIGNADWKIYDPNKSDGKGVMSEYINPPKELENIALQAKRVIGKDIIGFDFILTKEGYKIIDENGRPGLYPQCIKSANISINDKIVKLIKSKL